MRERRLSFPVETIPLSRSHLGLIATECNEAAAALRRLRPTPISAAARYSAISNGHQWLLTMTFVPNQPVEDRLIYVFESSRSYNVQQVQTVF